MIHKLSKLSYPLLINSYGRSGSSVLTRSLLDAALKFDVFPLDKINRRLISKSAWNLESSSLRDGVIYKTHDYPPNNFHGRNVKMIYTFANPVDVVLSLLRLSEKRGYEWINMHCNHLKVEYDNFKQITYCDSLGLQRHLESWISVRNWEIMFIKYERMWTHQREISDFVGFNLELPPLRSRTTFEDDKKLRKTLEEVYAPLIKLTESLDDAFTNSR